MMLRATYKILKHNDSPMSVICIVTTSDLAILFSSYHITVTDRSLLEIQNVLWKYWCE